MYMNVTFSAASRGTSNSTIVPAELIRKKYFCRFHLNQLRKKLFNAITGMHINTYIKASAYWWGIPSSDTKPDGRKEKARTAIELMRRIKKNDEEKIC